jgi:hypothetical protein
MEVRRPAAVLLQIPDLAHRVFRKESVSGLEPFDRSPAEVAVERVELDSLELMAKDDCRTVVPEAGVIGGRVDGPRQRGRDLGPFDHEKVEVSTSEIELKRYSVKPETSLMSRWASSLLASVKSKTITLPPVRSKGTTDAISSR